MRRARWAATGGSFLVSIAVVAALLTVAGGPRSSVSAAAPHISCGRGVPLEKCNPSSPPPTTGPQTPPFPASALATESCGPGFFDPATVTALMDHFGLLDCFRFVGSPQWVVFGDGMSVTSADFTASPGGAMVAVATCAARDSACLDPNVPHSFDAFTVSYPPLPASGRSNLETTFGRRLLWIYDGGCGLFTFDVASMRWFGHAQADLDALLSGTGAPATVRTPPAASGAAALAAAAPADTGDCQQ